MILCKNCSFWVKKKASAHFIEVFGISGACPIYRKEALEDVKINQEYLDEDFFAYYEDVDLAWRMQLRGWKSINTAKMLAAVIEYLNC